jgi:hypothetical protein
MHATTEDEMMIRMIAFTSNMKFLYGDFNAKVGRENIFKLTIGNEILHEIRNGVRVVNFAYLK